MYLGDYLGVCYQGVMVAMLDCGLKVSKLEFVLFYYIHFQTNTFRERYEAAPVLRAMSQVR